MSDPTGKEGELAGAAGAIGISGGLDASTAMAAVAATEFECIVLSGEAEFIGAAGEGNTIDSVLAHYGQDVVQTVNNMWEYYKSTITEAPGLFMKAWLHWNGEEFDAYLKCEPEIEGASGFASHNMPYVQK